MRSDGGFIKLYRKFTEWEWYGDSNTARVFLHILLNASWERTKWQGTTIQPGECLTTVKEISEELHLSVREVRTALNHLKSTNELTIKRMPKNSIIKVNNWSLYQQNDKQNVTQSTIKRQSDDFRLSIIEEDKEDKKGEKAAKAAAPTLEQVRKYCEDSRYHISPERFCRYYSATGWVRHGSPITDWQSLADEWERSEKPQPPQIQPDQTSTFDTDDLSSLALFSDD